MQALTQRVPTGVDGLDMILNGGLIPQRSYLVRGGPGQGKTTLGLHFLAAAEPDEPTLFVGFQEPEEEVRANAEAMGLDIGSLHFLTLTPDERFFADRQSYDVFASADVEQEPLAEAIVETVERLQPKRVFIDPLTQLRFLTADTFQYRKQVMSFLRYLTRQQSTVLFSSECGPDLPDDDLQFMADGVINVEGGAAGAAISVSKLRGSDFLRGTHHMRLGDSGLRVFPRMMPPAVKLTESIMRQWRSGSKNLDAMLHGGLEAGTITLITGPVGIGKSTLAAQFSAEAAKRDHKVGIYLFEEERETYLRRARALGIELDKPRKAERVIIEQIEPLRYLADEFAARVRQQVEEHELELVVLDSVAGFEMTLQGEGVAARLHTIAKTLSRLGVTVILVNETQVVAGQQFRPTEKGISYLSDNVLFLRYIEREGTLERTIGILKKRLSGFENTLRRYEIGKGGLRVADPIHGMHGLLTGIPTPQEGES